MQPESCFSWHSNDIDLKWPDQRLFTSEVLGLASGSSGYARRAVLLRCAELVRVPKWSQMHPARTTSWDFSRCLQESNTFFILFSISIFCYQKHFVLSFLPDTGSTSFFRPNLLGFLEATLPTLQHQMLTFVANENVLPVNFKYSAGLPKISRENRLRQMCVAKQLEHDHLWSKSSLRLPGRDRARCFFLDAEPKISLDARGKSLQYK